MAETQGTSTFYTLPCSLPFEGCPACLEIALRIANRNNIYQIKPTQISNLWQETGLEKGKVPPLKAQNSRTSAYLISNNLFQENLKNPGAIPRDSLIFHAYLQDFNSFLHIRIRPSSHASRFNAIPTAAWWRFWLLRFSRACALRDGRRGAAFAVDPIRFRGYLAFIHPFL